jgi:predicted PhzF superfamily epimerase YddE/YHI9
MKLRLFQIDAFASRVFSGNPAAVVPLERWLDDQTLQSIASENNLSETAFFVGEKGYFQIRWMTPTEEVDLCGHATWRPRWSSTRSRRAGQRSTSARRAAAAGERARRRAVPRLPSPPQAATRDRRLAVALGARPRGVLAARDYLAVFETEDDVRSLKPDMAKVAALDRMAVIATAPGRDCDFVSRFFVPSLGIPEDPVTGSATAPSCPTGRSVSGRRVSSPARSPPVGASSGARTGGIGCRSPAAA